jgi:hypothetical protein
MHLALAALGTLRITGARQRTMLLALEKGGGEEGRAVTLL